MELNRDGRRATMKKASNNENVASSTLILSDSPAVLKSGPVNGDLNPFRFLYQRYRYRSPNSQNIGPKNKIEGKSISSMFIP